MLITRLFIFYQSLIIHVIFPGFLLIGTILDIGVWYHVKDLKIYDVSDGDEKPTREQNNDIKVDNQKKDVNV